MTQDVLYKHAMGFENAPTMVGLEIRVRGCRFPALQWEFFTV